MLTLTHYTSAAHLFAVVYRSVIVDQQPKVKVCYDNYAFFALAWIICGNVP